MKGIRGTGVPRGTIWAKALVVALTQANMLKEIQRGTASLKMNVKSRSSENRGINQ